jgi:hypothetical protein
MIVKLAIEPVSCSCGTSTLTLEETSRKKCCLEAAKAELFVYAVKALEQQLHQESAQRNLNHQRQSRLVAGIDRLEFSQRPLAA